MIIYYTFHFNIFKFPAIPSYFFLIFSHITILYCSKRELILISISLINSTEYNINCLTIKFCISMDFVRHKMKLFFYVSFFSKFTFLFLKFYLRFRSCTSFHIYFIVSFVFVDFKFSWFVNKSNSKILLSFYVHFSNIKTKTLFSFYIVVRCLILLNGFLLTL